MRKWRLALASLSVWGLLGLQTASAQIGSYSPPQTNPHPIVSPYLNMQRGGNAAINYFGIVRPQLDTANRLQQLQQGQNYLQTGLNALGTTDTNPQNTNNFVITGHPVTFGNTSHYYPIGGSRFSGIGSSGGSSGIRSVGSSQVPTGYRR